MANLITEVYVSVDGLEFTKLDLHKDESIIMKYTQKDLQDISKIFAPYSQNFTFPEQRLKIDVRLVFLGTPLLLKSIPKRNTFVKYIVRVNYIKMAI